MSQWYPIECLLSRCFDLQLLIRKEEPDPNQGPWYLYLQLPKYKRQQENSMKNIVRQKSEPSLRKKSHEP